MSTLSHRIINLTVFVALTMIATAADLTVRPGPSAIAQAIDRAAEGDVLILQPGVYREHVRIEKRVTLRAMPGAIVDGAEELRADWKTEGDGVFTASQKSRPEGLLVDGRFIAEVRFDRAQTKGEWHWRTLLTRGPPLSGFTQIRALWMYHPQEQRIYVRFENGASPENRAMALISSSEALFTIAKASGVVVEGVTFAHGATAVAITDGAVDAVVRRCKVTSFEGTGIVLTDGAARCTVEECTITRGAFEEWQPSAEHSRPNYEIWRIHKDVGRYDRVGIEVIRAGAGNKILRNKLDRTFDGICLGDYKTESLDKPLTDPAHGRGTEIAENVIESTRDSGIELGVGCTDVNVHHNVLRRTHGGLRFKVPRIGPVFIHHNRLIDGAPFNIWFSMDASPAEGYVYHNTIVGGTTAAVVFSSFNAKRDFGAPKWHFLNNLVLSKEGFFDGYRNTPTPDFTATHNVVTGARMPWPGDKSRDVGSRYEVSIQHDADGKPAHGSAAANAGLDASTYFHGKPLPGCERGYFKGKAPDAGADEVE
ncbi:MAG: right-handed parallel beta-helix repeat-containing protein [Chthoniobacteraceae bacterium]